MCKKHAIRELNDETQRTNKMLNTLDISKC